MRDKVRHQTPPDKLQFTYKAEKPNSVDTTSKLPQTPAVSHYEYQQQKQQKQQKQQRTNPRVRWRSVTDHFGH
ncbi:hypothetical protein G9P44_002690 [Scheffersomyces stipitis]|nr:hypothetical protein G9P44_002690 [Scheffersomyces stipitis]